MLAEQLVPQKGKPIYVRHRNVMELTIFSDSFRMFRCADCGYEWRETITSPVIMPDGCTAVAGTAIDCTEWAKQTQA